MQHCLDTLNLNKMRYSVYFVIIFLEFFGVISIVSAAQNFPHIKTGGFDYDYGIVLNNQAEMQWLAQHHDMIIGLQNQSASSMKLAESVYDGIKAANPNVKFIQYIPFNTVTPIMSSWMENWAQTNGRNIEDLYYHYYYDTAVRLRNQSIVTFPGYGGGTATSLAGARVPSAWWNGTRPNINPTSQTFRDAFNNFTLDVITINSSNNKYADGVFLDTFDGTTDDYYNLHLENTIEMRNLGYTTESTARQKAEGDLLLARDGIEQYLTQTIGKPMLAIPNAAELDFVFNSRSRIYADKFNALYNEMAIEYLVTSTYTSLWWGTRIPQLRQLYDSMEQGNLFFLNSQTNYATNIPFNFTQFILAVHYLVNHPNGYFSYHKGSASWYGGENGSMRTTHWHQNIEYDIGEPVIRNGQDSWGQSNTNRFFVFADGGSTYQIMGREYDKALVLAKFGNVGGWANIGINGTTHSLGGNYRRLQEDNTLGSVINEVILGFGEGVILIKESQQTQPPADTTPPSAPTGLVIQ